jgi:hypothetical protein
MRRGLLATVALIAAAGCGYSPNVPSMKLICEPKTMACPDGYTCVSNTCWTNAEANAKTNLLGHWVFGASSQQVVACSDGSSNTMNLQGPDGFVDVTAGTTTVLASDYYCPWNLNVSGASTVIQPNQSCSAPDMTNPTVMYTWRGESFSLSSTDGKKGSLAASFPYGYTTATGNGTCTLHITADLTKS